VKAVLLYQTADDGLTKAPTHFPEHQARYQQFHAAGKVLMIGTFGDPQTEGAMGIFTSRDAAQEFVDADPFVIHGVVKSWELRDWHEALA
jgi:uncharacterized protein YciI